MKYLVIALAVLLLCSCNSQTKQAITQGHKAAATQAAHEKDQATTRAAEATAKGTVGDAVGDAQPVQHPIKAAGPAVKSMLGEMKFLNFIAFVVCALAVGFWIYALIYNKPLKWIGELATCLSGSLTCFSLVGIFDAPFLPWLVWIFSLAFIGFAVYEVVAHIKQINAKIDALFTAHASTANAVASLTVAHDSLAAAHNSLAVTTNAALAAAAPKSSTAA